jgi:CHAT domain-containing protein
VSLGNALGKFNRVLSLVRHEGVWRIQRYVPAEQELLERLLNAKDKDARRKLYDRNRDLVRGTLASAANRDSLERGARGQLGAALRLNDLAIEIAEGVADNKQLAICRFVRGRLYSRQSQYPEALAGFERSLTLFRGSKDQRGEAAAMNAAGIVYYRTGRYAEALRYHQDSLAIQRALGDRVGEINTLINIGNVYFSTSRHTEALRHYQDSLKIARQLGNRAGEASSLGSMGNVHYHRGRYAEALRCHQESLKIERDLGNRRGEGDSLNSIGTVYFSTSHYAEALRYYQDGLNIARELGNRQGEANGLVNIGMLHQSTGRYAEALRYHRDSLKIERELGNRSGEANALDCIGKVYSSIGRSTEALPYYQDSLQITRQLGDRVGEVRSLNNIGNVYRNTGRYTEALHHYQDSLKIAHQLGHRAGEASILGNLGIVYHDTGWYAASLRYQQDCLKIQRELDDRAGEVGSLNIIGAIHGSTGRHTEELRYCLDSLKLARELEDRQGEVSSLMNLGNAYKSTGHYVEALRHYQDGLKITRALGDRAKEAGILGNLGIIYRSTGRHGEALRHYQDALTIAHDLGALDMEARTLGNIGVFYGATGQFQKAVESCEAGLKLAESIGDPLTAFRCYTGIGAAHANQKHWSEAVAVYRQAIANIERVRGRTQEQSLQISFLAQYVNSYRDLARCLLELDQVAEAFAVMEQAKARALVDVLRTGKADIRKGMTNEQRQKEQQLQEHLTALTVEREALQSHKLNPKRQTELADQRTRARQDYEAFRRDLFLRLPQLQTRRAEFAPAALTELNHSLFADRPNLVVLSYLVGDQQTVLFVLTRGDKPGGPARLAVHRIEVGEKELAESVEQFRAACRKPAAGTPNGEDLYRWLLAPIEKTLEEASQLLIVPDGPLHTLPFHALKDDEDGKYLIQRCPVSYAPSATALLKMAELGRLRRHTPAARSASLLAVGISDFGRRQHHLPAAEKEARAVTELLGEKVRPLLGAEATKAGLRSAWMGRRYLHLATHGLLNEAAPLYSAVVLAQADGRDEGLLYARDLLEEELSAELVVLSACETGLGRNTSGEGLLGMTWAWFVAGVPSTVASQWSVADDSTARLMRVFYTELKAGVPKAEALRRAQLSLLKERKTRHPFYWAPFVLNGDPW